MELPIQNADQQWLFLDVEETKLRNSEDAETIGLVFLQNQPACPTRVARSLSHVGVCPYLDLSRTPRCFGELLGSGMLEEKGLEDQCDEETFGVDFFDELVLPGHEDIPFNPPSFRFATQEKDEFFTSPVTPSPCQLSDHLPVVGLSLPSRFTEECHSEETSLAPLPDGAGNGRTFSPCVGSEREEQGKLNATCPAASSAWAPFPAVRYTDSGLIGDSRALGYHVPLDCPSASDPTRFALTNQKVEVEEQDWTFDLDEFQQFCHVDFFDIFSSACVSMTVRETYNPFTTRLHPGVWLPQVVPAAA